MTKSQLRRAQRGLLNESVEDLTSDRKAVLVRRELVRFQKEAKVPEPNKKKAWTDEQIRVVLSYAPTEENMILLARAFGRGYGGIAQIFRWAGQSERRIKSERSEDAFIQQLLRIRKEVGWPSVGGDKGGAKDSEGIAKDA